MLICPVCFLPLHIEEKRAICPKGHCFDRARQGHFNLLCDSSSKGHGDSMEMLLARRQFLDAGYYKILADSVSETVARHFPSGGTLLDAGCGEGYYTEKVMEKLTEQGKNPHLFAFDIAKDAARLTAVRMKKEGTFFAASTFHIPMESGSVNVAMSLFAPYSEAEFLRVLAPGGYLLRAVPLEEHLFSLKRAVYENPTVNEAKAVIGEGFSLLSQENIRGQIYLEGPEAIQSLFEMTPYAHKTGSRDRKKLEEIDSLATEIAFGVLLYQKNF